jgi:competence ComEA-like helix-hairpin-helix protein
MTINRYLAAAFIVFVGTVASTGALGPVQDAKTGADRQQEQELAEVGEETTERACSECHSVDEVTGTRRTPRDWSDMVDTMAARGVTVTDKELATVKRYLARYFGLVAVNTASAEDLAAVLGLSPQDAGRIVEYRKKNGKFADLTALLKVPEVERMKIEAQPEALRFN